MDVMPEQLVIDASELTLREVIGLGNAGKVGGTPTCQTNQIRVAARLLATQGTSVLRMSLANVQHRAGIHCRRRFEMHTMPSGDQITVAAIWQQQARTLIVLHHRTTSTHPAHLASAS
jgi:hypothetical protein